MDQRLEHIIAADDAGLDRRLAERDRVEQLLELGRHLPDDQRLLIQQRFEGRVSYRELAILLGCGRRQVERRVHQILRRMADPRFALVAYHVEAIPPEARTTGRRIWLEGWSMRELARTKGPSLHYVRRHVEAVDRAARRLGLLSGSPASGGQRCAAY